MSQLADGGIFDIVGVVAYAGPLIRAYRMKAPHYAYCFRWLVLRAVACKNVPSPVNMCVHNVCIPHESAALRLLLPMVSIACDTV
jgi:hypothetical protein